MNVREEQSSLVFGTILCHRNGEGAMGGLARLEICYESYYRTRDLSIHQRPRLLRGRFIDPTNCIVAKRAPAAAQPRRPRDPVQRAAAGGSRDYRRQITGC